MIPEKYKSIIIKCAKKYKVSSVILFGSSATSDTFNDIDIGIKGITPSQFFNFYGELIMDIPEPIDIVNLDEKNSFNKLVEQEGIKLYS